jgi:hypothetical protein
MNPLVALESRLSIYSFVNLISLAPVFTATLII